MSSIDVLTPSGASAGSVELPAEVFDVQVNVPLIHQVVTAQLAAARQGTHDTKNRAEVRGGGSKPYKQKGTGRARQGSIRAPQFTGGGVVHGPTPRDYEQRTPKKMKTLALASALSARAGEGQVKVVEELAWTEPKTKQAKTLLSQIGAGDKALVVIGLENDVARRSFRNLTGVIIIDASQVNTYDVLWAETVVFSQAALDSLTGRGSEAATDTEKAEPAPERKTKPKAAPKPKEKPAATATEDAKTEVDPEVGKDDAADEAPVAPAPEAKADVEPKEATKTKANDEPDPDFELVEDDGDGE